MLRLLLLAMMLTGAAQARMPEQVVAGGIHQLLIRRTTEGSQALVVANRGRPRQAVLNDQSLEALPLADMGGQRALAVRGWSGGVYCCFNLAILLETRAGWHLAGRVDVSTSGTTAPLQRGAVIWLPDGRFDFWDLVASLGTELAPPIAWGIRNGRLMPDIQAMRRPETDALGRGCTELGHALNAGGPPDFANMDAAMRELPLGEWGQMPQGRRSWRPEAEFARRARCLLHMGHGQAALRLMNAWPAEQAGRQDTETQLRARLVCSAQALKALRDMNGAAHPWLRGRCGARERRTMTLASDR